MQVYIDRIVLSVLFFFTSFLEEITMSNKLGILPLHSEEMPYQEVIMNLDEVITEIITEIEDLDELEMVIPPEIHKVLENKYRTSYLPFQKYFYAALLLKCGLQQSSIKFGNISGTYFIQIRL